MINAWECVTSIDQCRNSPIANHAIGGKVTHEHVEICTKVSDGTRMDAEVNWRPLSSKSSTM
jgi:hypothetical protein